MLRFDSKQQKSVKQLSFNKKKIIKKKRKKESTCNAGNPGLIPSSGRSAEGYPLQYLWASLMAQLVKNLPAMWETWVRSLGWENPLEKGNTTHSSILNWWIPRGLQRLRHDWVNFTFTLLEDCFDVICEIMGVLIFFKQFEKQSFRCNLWNNSLGQNTGVGSQPFPSPGDLPNPGIKPRSPALQVDS